MINILQNLYFFIWIIYFILVSNSNLSTSINSLFNHNFCVIQWENSDTFCVVPQTSIFKSADFTEINDICFIENDGIYRKGIIKFKG